MRAKLLFILFGLVIGLAACSVQSKLNRNYKGKSQEDLLLEKGRPTRIETITGGQQVYIYEKSKFLKAAPINTGQFQYDKFESPKSIKNEIFKFYMSNSGVIADVKYEFNYER